MSVDSPLSFKRAHVIGSGNVQLLTTVALRDNVSYKLQRHTVMIARLVFQSTKKSGQWPYGLRRIPPIVVIGRVPVDWQMRMTIIVILPQHPPSLQLKLTRVEMALLGLTGEPTEGTGSGVSDRDGIG